MSISPPGDRASRPLLRIVDANLNRIGEGLRVLEEVARLALNDAALTGQLKTLRHEMIRGDWSFHQRLLEARDAEGDVGAGTEVAGESRERQTAVMVMANARRVQESLRLLEEVAKLPESILELPSDRYQQARFAMYSIEQRLLSRINRLDKTSLLPCVYAITGSGAHVEFARMAIAGGARAIQLHDTQSGKRELLTLAEELRNLCRDSGALFIVRDHLDIVLAAGADGLHVGNDNLPVEVVRKLLPLDRLLGVSVDTVEQAIAAQSAGADYVAVNQAAFEEARRAVSVPVVATGDMPMSRIVEILSAGGSVAVAENAEEVLRKLRSRVEVKNG